MESCMVVLAIAKKKHIGSITNSNSNYHKNYRLNVKSNRSTLINTFKLKIRPGCFRRGSHLKQSLPPPKSQSRKFDVPPGSQKCVKIKWSGSRRAWWSPPTNAVDVVKCWKKTHEMPFVTFQGVAEMKIDKTRNSFNDRRFPNLH